MRGFRWPALVLIPSLIVGAALFDDQERPSADVDSATPAVGIPVIAAGETSATTWFCAAASVTPDDNIIIVNSGAGDRTGTVTFMPIVQNSAAAWTPPVHVPVSIEARDRLTLRPADHFEGGFVSALVELDGGGVIVEHVNTFAELDATDRRPCATEAGGTAYLPAGATGDDAQVQLVVFNPFPDDAVLDVTFDTEIGGRNPSAYEALVVPGQSARLLTIDDEVPARERVSTFIEARSGRVVVDRVLTFDGGPEGRSGVSVGGALSAPRAVAYLPVGELGDGWQSSLVIMNPSSDVAAEVDITIVASADRVVEPLERRVFPRSAAVIDLSGDALAGALTDVTTFSVIVESSNGQPIIVERVDVEVGADRSGVSSTVGAPISSRVWVTDVSIADPSRSSIVILNPSFETLVEVQVFAPGVDEAVAELELGRGGRAVIELGDLVHGQTTLEVVASSPVVVERELEGESSRSSALALALVDDIVRN